MGSAIAAIILGLIELVFGRKLFWILVALGGFLLGWFLAPAIWDSMVTWQRILVGVILALVFALLSLVFLRIMVSLAGFLFFGAAAVGVIRYLGVEAAGGSVTFWVAYAIGGLIGAVLLFVFLDWALIVLTSLAGAGATAGGILYLADAEATWLEVVLFVVLAAIGIGVQAWMLRSRPSMVGRRRG